MTTDLTEQNAEVPHGVALYGHAADGSIVPVAAPGGVLTTGPSEPVIAIALTVVNQSAAVALVNAPSLLLQLTGLGTAGTAAFEGTIDGVNWFAVNGFNPSPFSFGSTTTTTTGVFQVNTAGLAQFRVRAAALTSGTITGAMRLSCGDAVLPLATRTDGSGALIVTPQIATAGWGAAIVGNGIGGVQHVGISGGNASNNCTNHRLIAAAGTNATSVKTAPGRIHGGLICNLVSAVRFLKLYDKATAPTVGTDTPIATVQIPALQTVSLLSDDIGIFFTTGIAYALTVGSADTDVTALTAKDVIVNLRFC